jgi:DNA-binding MarR family transcriptional regulator
MSRAGAVGRGTPAALRVVPAIHRATHAIALHVARLRDPVVSQGEAHVLAHLDAAGEATVGAIHRAFGHRRSTLTSILDRLEARRLVVRTSDARDRRTFVIALTPEGRAAARRVTAHLAGLEAAALRGCAPRDLQALVRVLRRFDGTVE